MSSVVSVANVALAAAAASMSWSMNLKVTQEDNKYTIDREGCHLWYLFGVVLMGLCFNLVTVKSNPMRLVILCIGWGISLASICAELAVVYGAESLGAYTKRNVQAITALNHTIFITSSCIAIIGLVYAARNELVS